MEDSSSLPGGAPAESPAVDGTPSQSREAEQQSRQSPAPPSSCSDANSVERHRHGEAPGSGCASTVVTHRGDVSDTCDMNVVDTHKGSVSDNSNAVDTDKRSVSDHCDTVDTEKGSVSDSPRNVNTEKGSIRKDPSTVEALHASRSDDTSTASTRQGKAPDDGDAASPQNKFLSVEDCSHNNAEPNVTSTNSVAGGNLNPTPSLDSHSAPLAHSLEPTAPRHPAKSHHSQNVQAVAAAPEIATAATSDKPEELHVPERQSPCSREGWESAERGGYCCPEEEDSDWEGPVDVELDDTPLALPERHSRKTSWSAVKALTRWMPLSRPKYPWTQMAGHQGSFLSGPGGSVLKLLVPREEKNLKLLMAETRLRQHVPRYHGTVDKDGACYVQLQDLLCEFTSPCVMDIKMGVRTYLEEELEKARKKPSLRKDLYQKLVSIDPDAPTEEERQQSAITKPRYMKFRDDMSSSSSLGFRIEGIKTRSGASKDYKNTRSREDVRDALAAFVGDNTTALEKYVSQLSEIANALEASDFFQSHEMVGSSLLFVHDESGRAGVWLIDFAKCCRLAHTVSVDHRSPWTPGNYEDGYLFGLDNLLSIFQQLGASMKTGK